MRAPAIAGVIPDDMTDEERQILGSPMFRTRLLDAFSQAFGASRQQVADAPQTGREGRYDHSDHPHRD